MKRIILVATFFLIFNSFMSLNAQWAKTYAYGSRVRAKSIQQTSDGGYIVAGWTRPPGDQSEDIWILKLSQYGAVEWQKTYGGSRNDGAYSIKQTSDGGYIVAGYNGLDTVWKDIWVLKLSSNGDIEWQKTYGEYGYQEAYSIEQTNDGGYIVLGYINTSGSDLLVLKLLSNGDIEWQKDYGFYGGQRRNYQSSLQMTIDGGYIITAAYVFGSGESDVWVLKLSSDGNIEWQRKYGGVNEDGAYSIKQTSDGGCIVAGYTKSFGSGGSDIWVLKLYSSGDVEWARTYSFGIPRVADEKAFSIQQTDDSGYIVGASAGVLLKLSINGDIEWARIYFMSHRIGILECPVKQTSDRGYINAGAFTTSLHPPYFNAIQVLKLSSNGEIDPSCDIQEADATYSDTSITPEETNVTPQNTNITPQNTNITPQETNALVNLICEYTLSISGYVKTAAGEGIEGVAITFSNTGGTATTDSSGNYSNKVSYDWSGTSTPSKAGYIFSPSSRSYTNVASDKTGEDYTATLLTYTISGTVSIGGSGLSGVVMNGLPGNPTTDASGNYSDTVDYDWSGTVTPSKAGYNFSPSSRSYTNVIADQTNQDYTATLNTYTLTTNVNPSGGGNVTKNPDKASYTHGDNVDLTASAITGYTFSGWTGHVPSGHENDNPLTITMDSNKTITANFTLMTYTISGTVTYGGSDLEGVLIDGLPGDPTSNNSGYYTATVDYGWSGTVTPSKAGYNFSPPSRTYTNVTADQTGQDYTAIAITPTISGSVKNASGEGIEGMTITSSNGGSASTTDASGNYSNSVNYGWSGTATPSKAGYTFSPSVRSYTNVTSNQAGQNYTAIINTYTLTTQLNPSVGGSITKNPDKSSYNHGENVELTANANSGYTFTGWAGNIPSGHESDNPVTITIDADKSITASFKKKGPCFIATAAYGSFLHPHVRILRDFRDKYLMSSKLGRALVNLYYKYSPFVANLIAKHGTLKIAVQISLLPFVAFSYSVLHFGPIITTIMLVFIFILPTVLMSSYRSKLRRVEAIDPKALASLD